MSMRGIRHMKNNEMNKRYYLGDKASLKCLELPSVYNIETDELYEIDEKAFAFFKRCAVEQGSSTGDRAFLEYCIEEGLLSDRYCGPKKIPARQAPQPSLRYLELQITDRCNLKCKHCYVGGERFADLPFESVKKVVTEFEEMQGLRLLITGGEPLLYERFSELNAILPEFEFRKVLFTNGMLLTRNVLRELHVQEIQVSIDGLEQAHDALRGNGTFSQAMKAIGEARMEGFQVSIATMIHTGNLNDFEAMNELFHTMGIKDWTVDVPCEAGSLRNYPELLPPPETAGKFLKYGFGEGFHGGGNGYICGHHLMSVLANGCAAKCAFYADDPVGKIDEGLESCWLKIKHMPLGEIECDCAFIDVCRGGCRYRATVLGDHRSKDPYRCAAFHGT